MEASSQTLNPEPDAGEVPDIPCMAADSVLLQPKSFPPDVQRRVLETNSVGRIDSMCRTCAKATCKRCSNRFWELQGVYLYPQLASKKPRGVQGQLSGLRFEGLREGGAQNMPPRHVNDLLPRGLDPAQVDMQKTLRSPFPTPVRPMPPVDLNAGHFSKDEQVIECAYCNAIYFEFGNLVSTAAVREDKEIHFNECWSREIARIQQLQLRKFEFAYGSHGTLPRRPGAGASH
ncbi:hypothetical protein M011DRAFT_474799 [Sporormia fimetaria CBS 119925]|uniref:Uncharacterized protein n=1 Tax=Sporormia fimetaria CBS 119925 TaxID=1340428 RepID=A0A6A6VMH0_9PLEO|nr:hypothetical protein M011DRAFT_474799 [Sporormia fimetaria CBS 119925]